MAAAVCANRKAKLTPNAMSVGNTNGIPLREGRTKLT